jgi:chromosome segregation ATPase
MKNRSKFTLVLTACLTLVLFAGACEDSKKIDEANKFVDSANKKADEVKTMVAKAAATFENIGKDLTDFEEGKKDHENDIKELVKSYDAILEKQKSIASDFTEASKSSPNEKFKAYYDMSAKDADKTGEVLAQSKASAQAILDSSDIEAFNKKMESIKAKSDALTKESEGIRAQLTKLESEVKALNK